MREICDKTDPASGGGWMHHEEQKRRKKRESLYSLFFPIPHISPSHVAVVKRFLSLPFVRFTFSGIRSRQMLRERGENLRTKTRNSSPLSSLCPLLHAHTPTTTT
jgi:hypothetical protein